MYCMSPASYCKPCGRGAGSRAAVCFCARGSVPASISVRLPVVRTIELHGQRPRLLSTTGHPWGGGAGHPPPPPLKDCLQRCGQIFIQPSANQRFSLAPSAPISLDQKCSSRPSVPLKPQHHLGGGGGGRHVALGVLFSSAAGGAYWPIATYCHVLWTAKTVKRPRQQPAQPPIRQLLGAADAQTAHQCRIQHSPSTPTTGLRERGNDTSKSTGRSGRQNAATRRNLRREERVTVQGPVKEQQPDGMSHGGLACRLGVLFSSAAGGAYWPIAIHCPSLGPFPFIGGGAHRPLTALCPSSSALPSLLPFPFPSSLSVWMCQRRWLF